MRSSRGASSAAPPPSSRGGHERKRREKHVGRKEAHREQFYTLQAGKRTSRNKWQALHNITRTSSISPQQGIVL